MGGCAALYCNNSAAKEYMIYDEKMKILNDKLYG